ncbi:unnamed protein product [Orchesella dallaii]|uniref:ABC transporter domain-containing protein n=1 Tax=Orchesella dallaii TaxID=48710 RepID=A0ABP1QIQ6_9HEXA
MNNTFDNPAFEKSPSPSEHSITVTKEPNGDNEDLEMEDLSDNQTVQDIFYTTCDPPISAISVRNAHKSYHKGTPVLTDFHMRVPIGTIYSLLGSSGCGKTTLLSCCVGIRKLDKGDILVFGHKPGTKESGVPGRRVGFMPQELSIYNELTIQEALNFYGRIYGMKRDQIFESTSFLVDFLDLPKASRRVGSLSGGQKRRVSIALALIHDPELLILDEPTVGVDPLLRESIWNHLVKLVTSGRTTVIITTHYIEEARQSNVIGIMRNGRLLAEKSPEALLIEYKVTLLEDIVLTLCRQDREEKKRQRDDNVETSAKTEWGLSSITKRKIGSESTIVEEGTIVGLRYESAGKNGNNDDAIFVESPKLRPGTGVLAVHNNGHISAPLKQRRLSTRENIRMNHSTQIQKLTALLIKNFIILMRNIGFLIFIFFVPAIQVILICLTIGSDPKSLLLGVINPENCDYLSKNWRDIGKECPIDTDALENSTLSCFYLSNLPEESYILEKETSEFNALQRIQKGYTYGYIEFPRDYTSNVLCKFGGKFDCPSHDEVIAGSNIILELDMSNKQIGQTMKRIFVDTYAKTTEAIKTNCQGKIKDTILSSVADLPYTVGIIL